MRERGTAYTYRVVTLCVRKVQDADASTKTSRKFRDDGFYERQVLTT